MLSGGAAGRALDPWGLACRREVSVDDRGFGSTLCRYSALVALLRCLADKSVEYPGAATVGEALPMGEMGFLAGITGCYALLP